jgi:hypothetical protein
MIDTASFHQFLSTTTAFHASVRTAEAETDTHESISHHVTSLRLVNKKISEIDVAVSDAVIASILGFISYYVTHHRITTV